FLTIVAVLFFMPKRLLAQDRPAPIVEAVVGRSGFIDEAWDYFTTLGGGARWFVTPRLAIGPEVSYLGGKFEASSVIITGNITFDFIRDDGRRPVVPYLAAGGGYMREKTLVGTGPGSTALAPFTSSEATASGGIDARIALGSHVFVAPEFRPGWEPEARIAVTIGIRPGRQRRSHRSRARSRWLHCRWRPRERVPSTSSSPACEPPSDPSPAPAACEPNA
ncbi:MAG: hypothetical protein ABW292_14970, partial [Vicinamibacterales bacterium]